MPNKTTSAVEMLDQLHEAEPEYRAELESEKSRLRAALAIYEARTAAEISQAELARRVGTTQSAIARLESADYKGHTLRMLDRIAAALGQRVELTFVPAHGQPTRTRRPRKQSVGV